MTEFFQLNEKFSWKDFVDVNFMWLYRAELIYKSTKFEMELYTLSNSFLKYVM